MYLLKAPTWRIPTLAQTTLPAPSTRFSLCLPDTLAQECVRPNDWSSPANFSDDPHDPGGATMCGIIQREYDAYRRSLGEPTQDVRLLTQAEGTAIYHTGYWQPHCPQLPAGLDLSFFDSNVNMGSEAIRILQVALRIGDDGEWGPETAAAVGAIGNVVDVIDAFTARRQAVYEMFRDYQYFSRDWTRRTTVIGNQSVAMASTS